MRSDTFIISPSAGPSFNDCALRTITRRYPFLLREAGYEPRKLEPSIGAAIGSGVHKGAEHGLMIKAKTGSDIGSDNDAVDAAMTEFDLRVEEGVIWDDTSPNRDAAQKQIRQMTMMYRKRIAPKIKPVLVEERIELEYAPGFILSGQIDTLASVGNEKPGLRDIKTGVVARANGVQYGNYWALGNSIGFPFASIIEDYLPRVPLSKPQAEPISKVYDIKACVMAAKATNDRLVRDVNAFLQTGDPNTFIANPMSMMCGDKYCPAFGTDICKLHNKD